MNEMVRVDNPYGNDQTVVPSNVHGAVAASDQQRAIAEVQAALVVARANPRDEGRSVDRILNACQRKGLAEKAIYSYAKGGSDIEGPSIHLARAIARIWGNLSFGIREMEQANGRSVVAAFAWDQESNTREERIFTVPHQIQLKGGRIKPLTDPRDIYELVANMGARRERACILSLIPDDVVEAAVDQSNATMRASADTSPEAIKGMVAAFQEFGISQPQIEARIQRRVDTIQPAQMVALKKIYRSLRDDMSTAEQWFEPIEAAGEGKPAEQAKPASGNAAAKDTLKQSRAKSAPKQADPAPAAEEAKPTMGEQLGDEIPTHDKAEAPQTDFSGPAQPEGATAGQTWLDTRGDEPKVRYAHQTQHGIKWYLQPQADAQTDAPAAEAEPAVEQGDTVSVAEGLIREARHADDEATLADIQQRFSDAKEGMSGADIKLVREALADRRNELA